MTASPSPFEIDPGELLRHDRWLRSLARTLVHGTEVEDLVQETWVAACDARPDTSQPLRSWLATVVRRLAWRRHRAAARRRARETGALRPDSVPSTAATVAVLELQRRVSAAVAAMAEPYRTVVLLRYYHDLPTAAIAAHCGCSEEAVRKRLERGIDELRQQLRQAHGPDWRHSAPVMALAGNKVGVAGSAVAMAGGALLMISKQKIVAAVALFAVAGLFGIWAIATPGSSAPPGAPVAAGAAAIAAAPAGDGAAAGPLAAAQQRMPLAPAVAAPPAGPQWSGRVLDPAGRPLGGVPLVITELLPEMLGLDPDAAPATTAALADAEHRGSTPVFDLGALPVVGDSSGDGSFAIVRGAGKYLLAGPGWATLRTPLLRDDVAEQDLVVVAAPAVAVRGVVVDATGQPLARVRIEARLPRLGDFPAVLDKTRSNLLPVRRSAADGSFAVLGLPGGTGELAFQLDGYLSAQLEVPAATREPQRVVLARVDAQHMVVRGRVVDARDLAVAGALVGLHGQVAHADQDGRFQLVFHRQEDGPPAASWLFAAHPGYQTLVLENFGARLLDPAQRELVLHLQGPPLAIAGRVVDAAGKAQADALVYLWDEPNVLGNSTAEDMAMPATAPVQRLGPGIKVWANTDADGAFELTGLRDRPYRLRVFVQAPAAAITSEPIAAGSRAVELRLPGELVYPRVAGRVTTAGGDPVAGVKLVTHLALYRMRSCQYSDDGASAVSDAEGRFELRAVPRVDARIGYSGEGLVPDSAAIDTDRPILDQRIVVVRRCHLRVQVDPSRFASAFTVVDAAGLVLDIMEIGTDGWSSAPRWPLEQGRSGVLSVSEKAVTLVLHGKSGEIARLPLRLVPGEVTVVQY